MSGIINKEYLWTSLNRPKSISLFKETARQGDKPIMTLRGHDTSLPCLRDLFISFVTLDPSEGLFAEEVFGDLVYWNWLKKQEFLQDSLKEWREVAEIKRKSMAFRKVLDAVEGGNYQAAKYLIEEPWKGQSKEVKKQRAKTTEKAVDLFKGDLERMQEEGLIQ